eukprot:scaffold65633_cov17-Tisochrysis_lutea.AAC.1
MPRQPLQEMDGLWIICSQGTYTFAHMIAASDALACPSIVQCWAAVTGMALLGGSQGGDGCGSLVCPSTASGPQ